MPGKLLDRVLSLHQPVNTVGLDASGGFVLVGLEAGLALYDAERRLRARLDAGGPPVDTVVIGRDLQHLIVATRPGEVVRFDLDRRQEPVAITRQTTLYTPYRDIHSLSYAEAARLLAVGHRGQALSVLTDDGKLVWRQHPDDGTATVAERWSVALDPDGQVLYAGSACHDENIIAALNPHSGELQAYRYEVGLVSNLVALASGGVAATITNGRLDHRLVVLPPDLSEPIWMVEFNDPATALCTDHTAARLVVSVGAHGVIQLYDAHTGVMLADPLALNRPAGHLAITRGSQIAATLPSEQQIVLATYRTEGRL
jgi:outer membrane protein assembly factor BamB